ncbi:hypothetical protein B0H17DRAFT_484590 [Mycena rosella]|uniref:Secreted protein n=1 Tax=Mycena rosella TaxID=1033263 RepID=A0AAD7C395_MYCRO|nr:hypothetical protein B0H17DRAFT_484590 [Mycena rosella]
MLNAALALLVLLCGDEALRPASRGWAEVRGVRAPAVAPVVAAIVIRAVNRGRGRRGGRVVVVARVVLERHAKRAEEKELLWRPSAHPRRLAVRGWCC